MNILKGKEKSAHEPSVGANPVFHSMKQLRSIATSLDWMLIHRRLSPSILSGYLDSLPVTI